MPERPAGGNDPLGRSTFERGACQLDRARSIERENRRLGKERYQLLGALGFSPIGVAVLRHKSEVVKRSQQAAVVRPAERDF